MLQKIYGQPHRPQPQGGPMNQTKGRQAPTRRSLLCFAMLGFVLSVSSPAFAEEKKADAPKDTKSEKKDGDKGAKAPDKKEGGKATWPTGDKFRGE